MLFYWILALFCCTQELSMPCTWKNQRGSTGPSGTAKALESCSQIMLLLLYIKLTLKFLLESLIPEPHSPKPISSFKNLKLPLSYWQPAVSSTEDFCHHLEGEGSFLLTPPALFFKSKLVLILSHQTSACSAAASKCSGTEVQLYRCLCCHASLTLFLFH